MSTEHAGNGSNGSDPSPAVDEVSEAPNVAPEAVQAEVVELTPEQQKIEALEAEIDQLQGRVRHYAEVVDRVRTEMQATRGRLEREHERVLDEHKAKAVEGLLPVADTLDSALKGADAGGEAFVQGVQIVRAEFEKALADLGLERFDPTGDVFDPGRHDALTMMPVADAAHDGKVVQVLHHGARVGDKIVRAASVVVGKYTGPAN